MKKTKKELEAELKAANAKVAETQKMLEAAKKEDGDGGGAGDGGGDGGGNSDADSDKKLVKSMIKKHLGDDSDGSDEEEAMCSAAMESYKEMGYTSEAAADAAGHAMKLAKHEAKKSKEAGAAGAADPDGTAGAPAPAGKKEAGKVNQESERRSIQQQARIASLEQKLNARDVADHIETTLQGSGLPRSVTKTFRESVKESRSVADVDSKFKLFMEAYRAAGGEAGVPNLEKTGGGDAGSVTGFGDCLSD